MEKETKDNIKRKIAGFAKITGKYTLKSLGKGIELANRGAVGIAAGINALLKNPAIRRIATTAGLIAASVSIPGVGMGLLAVIGGKYLIDLGLRKSKRFN